MGKPNFFDIRPNFVDFVAEREFGGHNSDWFDLKMLHVTLDGVETFDTMVMGVDVYGGRDGRISLRQLCKKAGVVFDKSKAHRAEYDVMKCIECYCVMKNSDAKTVQESFL
jgi:DNA polymerase III epsilon subunit-like protein